MDIPQNTGGGPVTVTENTKGNGTGGLISPTAQSLSPEASSPTPCVPNLNSPTPAPGKATEQKAQTASLDAQKTQMHNEILWQAAQNAKEAGAPVSFAEILAEGEWQVVYVFQGARICHSCRYPYLGDKCEREHAIATKATT